ncbi:hybrid sensor histidine kinase/response regulator transcription factor [Spirosoma jeollabukense]
MVARRWFTVLFMLAMHSLVAQHVPSRNLSLRQGLPEYYVSGIVQDKAGFIWIATRDGLARYDGRRFKLFRHQPRDPSSLANNVISSLQLVSDSALLVHLETGTIQLFNPQTEQVKDLLTRQRLDQERIPVTNILLTADQRHFWVRNERQLTEYSLRQNRFTRHPLPKDFLPDDVFAGNHLLLDSSQHRIYAPYPGGIAELNTRTGQYQAWPFAGLGEQGAVESYLGIPISRRANGELLTVAPGRLIAFSPHTHRFRTISIPDKLSIRAGVLHAGLDGNTYFTYGMSVYRLSPDDTITPLWTASRIDYQNYFHALLLDRSGMLWVGTNGDGVQQLDLKALPTKTYPYRVNYLVDLLAGELGLTVPNYIRGDEMAYSLRWSEGVRYLAGYMDRAYRLSRADLKHHQFQPSAPIYSSNSIPGNGLKVTTAGEIWLYNSYRGLLQVDTTGRVLAEWPLRLERVGDIQPMGSLVWVGTEFNGLYAYDLRRRRIVHHLRFQAADSTSPISDQVLCLAADPADTSVLWVGTQEGLSRLDTRSLRCRNWTERQGLPNATINTLLTDSHQRLWFSTLQGISRLDPRTGRMRHFTTDDGLLDIEYRRQHAAQLPDGRLAFGGITGMTVFNPLTLEESPRPIPLALTALRIGNVPIEPRPSGSPLTRSINDTPTLRLTYTQNFLSLEFAGLQFNKPTTLQYRYQLAGVDAGWVYVGNQTLANYTHLAPGSYEFRAMVADASGHWSPLMKTLRIVIDPPWWQTWWAYGVYGLMLLVLIRAYIQYRINQAQLGQEIALQKQEARLIQQNADWQTRFFTNITHEFRTPLTLIINPLERLMEPLPPMSRSSLQQQYGVMYRNAQRLLRLINQLLDIAKLEAGQLTVTESQGNLPAFVAQLVDSFRPRAEKKGLQLTYEASGLTADYRFDAHKLESIGYNLLANALKFTPPGGRIDVHLNPENVAGGHSGLQLVVSDTGVGIAPEQLSHIFDRFYQGASANASSGPGTGIGLFVVAEFSRLMGGSVKVESQPGQGTTFTVTLPLEPADAVAPLVETLPDQPSIESGAVPDRLVAPATAPLVLVVEDNDELREFIAGEMAGTYRVLTAANGEEGWQLCLSELPELVISDVMMPSLDGPEVDGFTLVERIKTTPLTAHIAVMLLTAKTMTDSRIQGLSVGANDYLTKPFNVRELQLRISNLLHHQQQLRQHWQQQMSQLGQGQSALPAAPLPVDDPFLHKLYSVLDTQLTNSAFSVEQLADELAVSPRTLLRKLTTLTGSNAAELMRSYRLQKAAAFLQAGCSVSETAEKTGFESVSHFSRSFKAQFAVSPSAYGLTRSQP